MKHHQRTRGKSDQWGTPPEIVDALGKFDLDPCAMPKPGRQFARINFAAPHLDGFVVGWDSQAMRQANFYQKVRVWCNPPFNRYERPKWMKKMSEHGNGIMLIPAATETAAFFSYVWQKADAVCFLNGRPHFHYPNGKRASFNCGTAIVLVAYGKENITALFKAKLGYTLKIPRTSSHA